MYYALASNLRGFGEQTTLRVKVTREAANYAWVVTADLVDAGTPLTLDRSQIEPLEEYVSAGWQHREGFVTFA